MTYNCKVVKRVNGKKAVCDGVCRVGSTVSNEYKVWVCMKCGNKVWERIRGAK